MRRARKSQRPWVPAFAGTTPFLDSSDLRKGMGPRVRGDDGEWVTS